MSNDKCREEICNSSIVGFSPRFKLNHWIKMPKLSLNLLINYVNDVQIYAIFKCSNIHDSCNRLVHIRRVANQTNHYLAKFATENVDRVWIEESPPCIVAVSTFDLMPGVV